VLRAVRGVLVGDVFSWIVSSGYGRSGCMVDIDSLSEQGVVWEN